MKAVYLYYLSQINNNEEYYIVVLCKLYVYCSKCQPEYE